MTGQPTPRNSIKVPLLKYFVDRPGVVIYIDDLAADTGLSRKQILSGIYNMRAGSSAPAVPIEVMIYGRAWRYMPNTTLAPVVVKTRKPAQPLTEVEAVESKKRPAAAPVSAMEARRKLGEPSGPALRMFEEVGNTRDGALILRADDGGLYRAEAL